MTTRGAAHPSPTSGRSVRLSHEAPVVLRTMAALYGEAETRRRLGMSPVLMDKLMSGVGGLRQAVERVEAELMGKESGR